MIPLSSNDMEIMSRYGITNVYDIPAYARYYNDPELVTLWGKIMQLNALCADGFQFQV